MVRLPAEVISPSILPSTTRSSVNLTLPLMLTSELSTLRVEELPRVERGEL